MRVSVQIAVIAACAFVVLLDVYWLCYRRNSSISVLGAVLQITLMITTIVAVLLQNFF